MKRMMRHEKLNGCFSDITKLERAGVESHLKLWERESHEGVSHIGRGNDLYEERESLTYTQQKPMQSRHASADFN